MSEGSNSVEGPSSGFNRDPLLELFSDVLDPELLVSMTSVGLLRVVREPRGVKVMYKPPSIFTPPFLVIAGCIAIIRKLLELGLDAELEVEHYYLAEEINRRVSYILKSLKAGAEDGPGPET